MNFWINIKKGDAVEVLIVEKGKVTAQTYNLRKD